MFLLIVLFIYNYLFINVNCNNCQLPAQWSGNWYQNKDVDLMSINRTNFINRGICIEHKQDKFVFYDSKEACYRCVFIMQKHFNVLQYRASYCTEQSDFYSNCQNLSPESELVTIYRDNALAEKCPLSGLYTILQSSASNYALNSAQLAFLNLQQDSTSTSDTKCNGGNNENSFLMECADPTMIKFQFSKCASIPTFDVSCVAHWTEGNTNYLIGRTILPNQRRGYRCLVYTESNAPNDAQSQSSLNRNLRYKYDENGINAEDFIELSQNINNNQNNIQDTIQISISQDEFCRNIDNIIDDQYSFTFTKVSIAKYFNPLLNTNVNSNRNRINRNTLKKNNTKVLLQNSISLSSNTINSGTSAGACRFPKWFNKRWNNLKQNKFLTLDHKLNTLIVFDDKKSSIIDKYDCMQVKTKKTNHFQAIVRSLNGCSNSFQCFTIINRSEFLAELRFGKVKYSNGNVDCTDHFNHMELVYVDTSFGVTCPFKGGIYRKYDQTKLFSIQQPQDLPDDLPCKFMTQTQTLQIGCQNDQQYSLRTKLCYPNQLKFPSNDKSIQKLTLTQSSQTNSYTQLESEINLICLAHWNYDDNLIVISRSMSNDILCSVWSTSDENKNIKFYEIDSNCNFYKKNYKLNHEFQLINKCDEKTLAYSSSTSSSSILSTEFLQILFFFKIFIIYITG